MTTPSPLHDLLAAAFDKVSKATSLYRHLARKVMPFDPESLSAEEQAFLAITRPEALALT